MSYSNIKKMALIAQAALIANLAASLAGCASSAIVAPLPDDSLRILKETCEKYGAGDTVYQVIKDVPGIYKAVEIDSSPDWASQYGMKYPWVGQYVDTVNLYPGLGEPRGGYYWFVEASPTVGVSNSSPHLRSVLTKLGQRPRPNKLASDNPPLVSPDGFLYGSAVHATKSLISQYGWTAKDLTTNEMRAHWITGGRLIVFDRHTGKTLAERVHFYRATGPSVKMAWAMGVGCDQAESGYTQGKYIAPNWALFVKHVLQPMRIAPTDQQLIELNRE